MAVTVQIVFDAADPQALAPGSALSHRFATGCCRSHIDWRARAGVGDTGISVEGSTP